MNDQLASDLALAFAAIAPNHLVEFEPQADGIAGDDRLLGQLVAGKLPSPVVRIWRQQRCIALPRRFARSAGIAEAAAMSAKSGWPVGFRLSGGTAVAQHPGILNVSLFLQHSKLSLEEAFDSLTVLLACGFAAFGIEVDAGLVAGACCDGRHNLRWRDRKLAGTAGAVRTGIHGQAVLVHAAIAVAADLEHDLEAVSRLERGIGIGREYDVAAHATVTQSLTATRRDRLHWSI